MLSLLSLVAGSALAQQPGAQDAAAPWPQAGEEIVIEASTELAEARRALDRAIEDLGFRRKVIRDDRTIYPRPALWKSKLVLFDDGRLEVRTPSVVPMMLVPRARSGVDSSEVVGVEGAGLWSSPPTTRAVEGRIYQGLADELADWHDALWARSFAERRMQLREEVLRAWHDGLSPEGRALPTWRARRAWLLERWLNTADSTAGEAVRVDLEVFIDDVVQRSAGPLTADEIAAANAQRTFARALAPTGA